MPPAPAPRSERSRDCFLCAHWYLPRVASDGREAGEREARRETGEAWAHRRHEHLDAEELLGTELQRLQGGDELRAEPRKLRCARRRARLGRATRGAAGVRLGPDAAAGGRDARVVELRVVEPHPADDLVRALGVGEREQPQVLQRLGVTGRERRADIVLGRGLEALGGAAEAALLVEVLALLRQAVRLLER